MVPATVRSAPRTSRGVMFSVSRKKSQPSSKTMSGLGGDDGGDADGHRVDEREIIKRHGYRLAYACGENPSPRERGNGASRFLAFIEQHQEKSRGGSHPERDGSGGEWMEV